MVRKESVHSLFVASPSDVAEERERLQSAIEELNATWSRQIGARIELVRWETHAYPGVGADPQDVINREIPADFDIFIGIMWYRFGKPTGRAGSGTLEEFQLAKARYDRDPSSVHIMMYFKDAPAPMAPSEIDVDQIRALSECRSSLGDAGVLFTTFKTSDEFEKLARIHLSRHMQAQFKGITPLDAVGESDAGGLPISDDASAEDAGLLDLFEEFEGNAQRLNETSERIQNATIEVGRDIENCTARMERLSALTDTTSVRAARIEVARAAAHLDQYARRMQAEIPIFSQNLSGSMSALVAVSEISYSMSSGAVDRDQLKMGLTAAVSMSETLSEVEGQIASFRDSVAALPPMSKELNRARRATVAALQALVDELRTGHNLAAEAVATIEAMLRVADMNG